MSSSQAFKANIFISSIYEAWFCKTNVDYKSSSKCGVLKVQKYYFQVLSPPWPLTRACMLQCFDSNQNSGQDWSAVPKFNCFFFLLWQVVSKSRLETFIKSRVSFENQETWHVLVMQALTASGLVTMVTAMVSMVTMVKQRVTMVMVVMVMVIVMTTTVGREGGGGMGGNKACCPPVSLQVIGQCVACFFQYVLVEYDVKLVLKCVNTTWNTLLFLPRRTRFIKELKSYSL